MARLALVYTRQSDPRPGERSVSLDLQEEACRDLPAVKACTEVRKLRDAGISGKSTTKRKAFLTLLETIKTEAVEVVAFYDQSRAFRKTSDALEFYELMEQHPQTKVVLVHGQFEMSATGGFSYTVLAAAHQMERKMVSQKTSDALRYKVLQGEMVGPVPLGYRRDNGKVVIDLGWAKYVVQIFKTYATGNYSTRTLAKKLNTEGNIPARWQGGAKQDSLAQLLRHPAYIGKTIQDPTIAGNWQPIVERELWQQVQSLLSHNKSGGRGASTVARAYAFRGLLVCSDCGQRLHGHTSAHHAYYICRSTGAIHDCGQSMREDRLLPFGRSVLEWLEKSPRNSSVASAVKQGLRSPEQIQNVSTASVDAQIGRLKWRFDNGYCEPEEFKEKMAHLRNQREQVSRPAPIKMTLTGLVQAWDAGNNNVRRGLLQNMFSALVVSHGQLIDWKARPEVEEELNELLAGFPFKSYRRLKALAV